MTKTARIAKHMYRDKHTKVTTHKNEKGSKVVRKERTRRNGSSPSMKEWAATCEEGRAWLKNKKQS